MHTELKTGFAFTEKHKLKNYNSIFFRKDFNLFIFSAIFKLHLKVQKNISLLSWETHACLEHI